MKGDPILESMAHELRAVLINCGLDPHDPPTGKAPSLKAFAEYQRRGGKIYADAQQFTDSLVARVGQI